MKYSWGTGIFVFLIVFLIACGIFIWFAYSQKLNLVEKDYYEKGAHHTKQMEIEQRSIHYFNQIYFEEDQYNIIVFFPDQFSDELKSGKILFFRPSDNYRDIEFVIKLKNNKQIINKKDLIQGRYLIKISWESDQVYYIEKEFFVH